MSEIRVTTNLQETEWPEFFHNIKTRGASEEEVLNLVAYLIILCVFKQVGKMDNCGDKYMQVYLVDSLIDEGCTQLQDICDIPAGIIKARVNNILLNSNNVERMLQNGVDSICKYIKDSDA